MVLTLKKYLPHTEYKQLLWIVVVLSCTLVAGATFLISYSILTLFSIQSPDWVSLAGSAFLTFLAVCLWQLRTWAMRFVFLLLCGCFAFGAMVLVLYLLSETYDHIILVENMLFLAVNFYVIYVFYRYGGVFTQKKLSVGTAGAYGQDKSPSKSLFKIITDFAKSLVIIAGLFYILIWLAGPDKGIFPEKKIVSEALSIGLDLKRTYAEFYQKHGNTPKSLSDISDPISGSYVQDATIDNSGRIIITMKPDTPKEIANKTIIFTPYINNGDITWDCFEGDIPSKYRPVVCIK